MKHQFVRSMDWRFLAISFVAVFACSCESMPSSPLEYNPPSGRGPIVILLSGFSGPALYKSYADEVSRLGYYAVLFDGKEFYELSPGAFKRTIEQVQRSPKALPGKVAVIGFSMGGAAALGKAALMPDLVSAVITYYPMTKDFNTQSLAAKFQVPTLVFAGERDTLYDCCLIETMRAMERGAKEAGKPFELVAYKEAGHAFNLTGSDYRAEDAADAWQHTIKMLSQYQPLR
jgi:pimeloyl-ACP methyl ester carboxylesterase